LADNAIKSTLDIESRIEENQASINKLVISSENEIKKIKTVNELAANILDQLVCLVSGALSANDAQQQEFYPPSFGSSKRNRARNSPLLRFYTTN
jgi:hypothetical protein